MWIKVLVSGGVADRMWEGDTTSVGWDGMAGLMRDWVEDAAGTVAEWFDSGCRETARILADLQDVERYLPAGWMGFEVTVAFGYGPCVAGRRPLDTIPAPWVPRPAAPSVPDAYLAFDHTYSRGREHCQPGANQGWPVPW